MRIILGSSSSWRAQIMRTIVDEFEVMEPGIDERSIRSHNPAVLVSKLAVAKSLALRDRISEPAILITSDQVVTCAGTIREKPKDDEQARQFLRSYRENPAVCITAVLGYRTDLNHDVLLIDRATVWFKKQALTNEAIERLIEEGLIFTSAGGFCAGHESFWPYVDRIEGELESVMGLPKRLTEAMLDDLSEA